MKRGRAQQQRIVAPRLPVDSGEFDGLIRDLLARMDTMARRARPTMGTVTAVQGGDVIVHIDGERISRSIGFARKKGVSYKDGDRVKLSQLRNDEYVVDGLVDSQTLDRSVGRNQIAEDAIGQNELNFQAVTRNHLESNFADSLLTDSDLAALRQALAAQITNLRARMCDVERSVFGAARGVCGEFV
jgi:hypothetical protein